MIQFEKLDGLKQFLLKCLPKFFDIWGETQNYCLLNSRNAKLFLEQLQRCSSYGLTIECSCLDAWPLVVNFSGGNSENLGSPKFQNAQKKDIGIFAISIHDDNKMLFYD